MAFRLPIIRIIEGSGGGGSVKTIETKGAANLPAASVAPARICTPPRTWPACRGGLGLGSVAASARQGWRPATIRS